MAGRVRMCGIDTVNGALGREWGVGNELTGSEFNLGYIKFALLLWVSTRVHSSPFKTEEKNEWNHTSTHSHTAV
jgi:hypothetical protein